MESYVVTDDGGKVLPGSRRPDGTLRKERRIRAGYIPQDEQPVYQSTGVMARRDIPKCPGLDPDQAGGSSSAAKSKAAKKNEKRKAKKADAPSSAGAVQQATQHTQQPAAAAAPQQPQPQQQQQQQPQPPQQQAAAAGCTSDSAAAVLEKQIKALSKKVRQCQALVDRQATGDALSQQEAEKLAKMAAWQEEVKDLEHQLSKLLV